MSDAHCLRSTTDCQVSDKGARGGKRNVLTMLAQRCITVVCEVFVIFASGNKD